MDENFVKGCGDILAIHPKNWFARECFLDATESVKVFTDYVARLESKLLKIGTGLVNPEIN